MLWGTLLKWGIIKISKTAITCHPPCSTEALPTCFKHPGHSLCEAEYVPSQTLKESCENNWGPVLNLKSQVSLPEEVIKNLAHLPMHTLLPRVWPAPCCGLCSLLLCLVSFLFSALQVSLHFASHPSSFPWLSWPEKKWKERCLCSWGSWVLQEKQD